MLITASITAISAITAIFAALTFTAFVIVVT
jgi:hypothetical protein